MRGFVMITYSTIGARIMDSLYNETKDLGSLYKNLEFPKTYILQTLKELQKDGIVYSNKIQNNDVYSLTKKGKNLLEEDMVLGK